MRSRHVRFVVLSTARSGSSQLVTRLNQEPGVLMHEEIFHPGVWADQQRASPGLTAVAYAEAVLADCPPGGNHVGFKMWRGQAPDACAHLLGDPLVRKVILERENRLASYASLLKAYDTDVWNVLAGHDPGAGYAARPLPRFDVDAFEEHVARRDEVFRYYREACRGATLNITYQGLVDGDHYRRCLDFLGVASPGTRAEGYRRLSTGDIVSRFDVADHAEIAAVVTRLGHPEWLRPETSAH